MKVYFCSYAFPEMQKIEKDKAQIYVLAEQQLFKGAVSDNHQLLTSSRGRWTWTLLYDGPVVSFFKQRCAHCTTPRIARNDSNDELSSGSLQTLILMHYCDLNTHTFIANYYYIHLLCSDLSLLGQTDLFLGCGLRLA